MSLKSVLAVIFQGFSAPAATKMTTEDMINTAMKRPSNKENDKMNTSLYKISQASWIVTSDVNKEPAKFTDVDKACDYLIELGVGDDEIDRALVDMAAKGTKRANFNDHGFAFSDQAGFGS